MDDKEEEMKEALQGVIDSTEDIIEAIGKMEWDRIERAADNISSLSHNLKVLSGVN